MWVWNSAKILERTVPTHACEAQGNGRAQGRTVSGNSSVADCSRRLSSRSPKNTGSGFVSSASLTLEGSMGSASAGFCSAMPERQRLSHRREFREEGDGFVVFVGAPSAPSDHPNPTLRAQLIPLRRGSCSSAERHSRSFSSADNCERGLGVQAIEVICQRIDDFLRTKRGLHLFFYGEAAPGSCGEVGEAGVSACVDCGSLS